MTKYAAFLLGINVGGRTVKMDRSGIGPPKIAEKLLAMGNALTAVILVDGLIAGTWKRKIKAKEITFETNFFMKPSIPKTRVFEETKKQYQNFFLLSLDGRLRRRTWM